MWRWPRVSHDLSGTSDKKKENNPPYSYEHKYIKDSDTCSQVTQTLGGRPTPAFIREFVNFMCKNYKT